MRTATHDPNLTPAWVGRSIRDCYTSSPALCAVLLLHGGFFFRAGSSFEQHFLAFPGVREFYIAVCCLAALLAFLESARRGRFFSGDLLLLSVAVCFALGSAGLSYIKFGQPFAYGLFEERRVLLFFGFFVILAAYYQFDDRPEALLGAVNWTVLIYVILGFLMQAGLLGDLASRDIPEFDPRKYRILVGTDIYALSALISTVMMARFRAWGFLVPLLVSVAGLILVSQTRSTMAIVLIGIIIILASTNLNRFIFSIFCGGMAAVGLSLAYLLGRGPHLFGGSIAELDVRVHTATRILDELIKNNWVGMGALSLQWQNGFHRIFNRHFFLSDVGVVGELFRFGIFLPLLYLVLALMLVCYLRQTIDQRGRSIVFAILVYIVLNAPGGGVIAFAGGNWAILCAFAVVFRKYDVIPRTMGTRLKVVQIP